MDIVVFYVAVATKSMPRKTPQTKDFSHKEMQNKLDTLSKEIVRLSHDTKANTLFVIATTSEVVLEHARLHFAELDFSRTRVGILNTLVAHNGTMILTDLSRKVLRSKYSVTRIIDKLEKEGYVKRESIHGDRRAKNINITRKGLDFIEKRIPQRKVVTEEVVSCFTTKQMVLLTSLLLKLRKHLLGVIAAKGLEL